MFSGNRYRWWMRFAIAAIMSLALVVGAHLVTRAASASDAPFFRWTDRAPMPTARYGMGSTVLDGLIYVIGGTQDYGTAIGDVEVYDPGTNKWTSRAPMLTPRKGPTVFSAGGKVYAIGGHATGTDSLSTVEVYDPATNSWASLPNAPVPAIGMAAAETARGEIYLFGGYPGCCGYYLPNVYRFDPTTGTYTRRADMPLGVEGALAIPGDDGKIYLFGGNGSQAVNFRQVYVYDPVGNSWEVRQDMPYGVTYASGFKGPDGYMYVFNSLDSGPSPDGNAIILRYNPADDTWTVDPSAPRRASLQTAVLAENGKAYLFGGADLNTSWPYAKIAAVSEGTLSLNGGVPDSTAPTTKPSATTSDGNTYKSGSWTNKDVTVDLSASDEEGGSGVKEITYKLTDKDGKTIDEKTVSGDKASVPITSEGEFTISYYATDKADNSGNPQTFTVKLDKTAPTLKLSSGTTEEATGPSGAAVNYTATATDNLDDSVSVRCDPTSGSTFGLGDTTVTCSAKDKAGNEAKASFTVTVRDTTAPTISGVPSDIVEEATGADGAKVTYTSPTATDLVDGDVAVSCDPASGSTFPIGKTTVTCTATDKAGNKATGGFAVKAQDTTKPTVSEVPPDATQDASGPSGAQVSYTVPTATDGVDGSVKMTCDPAPGSTFSIGETTVNCSGTDKAGNEAKASFTVTVRDTTPPTISGVPSDITEQATDPSGARVSYVTPTATDLVDGEVSVSCDPASGSTFAVGTTKVTCTATDKAGNKATASFNVTIEAPQDKTAPTISGVPSDITAEATSKDGAKVSYTAPTAKDDVDGDVPVSCDPASGSTFPIGTTKVTCTAKDKAGNEATANFNVTVRDTTKPELALPSDITAEATSKDGARVDYDASATDLVDDPITPDCSPASGSTFALGDTTVNCTATDKAGNKATGSFKVTVRDTTPPTLNGMPKNQTVEATGPRGATVTYTDPTASDSVDGAVTPTCKPASGSTFPIGKTAVTCTATDKAGNKATQPFTVTVKDTTAPTVKVPSDVSWKATSTSGAKVTYPAPTATDIVDGDLSSGVSCDHASGSTFALGSTTVTCTAADKAGNKGRASFKVNVVYDWSGVLQPIDGGSTDNYYSDDTSIFKLGSTVPVKFRLTGDSGSITNATAKLYVSKVTNGVAGKETEATSTAAANTGNTFRNDSTSKQYIFNLSTEGTSWTTGTYQLRIDLGDGVKHTVYISLK